MLVEKQSACAADELCAVALTRHPHSSALAEKAAAIVLPAGRLMHTHIALMPQKAGDFSSIELKISSAL